MSTICDRGYFFLNGKLFSKDVFSKVFRSITDERKTLGFAYHFVVFKTQVADCTIYFVSSPVIAGLIVSLLDAIG